MIVRNMKDKEVMDTTYRAHGGAIAQMILDRRTLKEIGFLATARLAPGRRIEPHIDQGAPATFYQRFQICLQSRPGCVFRIEDEQVMFKPGEIWLINNNAEHEVINNSDDDRICLIVDLRIPKQ